MIVALLTACMPAPEATDREGVAPGVGGSEYTYVVGFDPDAVTSITGGSHTIVHPGARREAFGAYNQPSTIHPELEGDALVFDPDLASGETDWAVFPSSWWPMSENGIAARWSSEDQLSPVERYDELFHPGETRTVGEVEHWYYDDLQLPASERPEPHTHPAVEVSGPATEWELKQHGVYQSVHPDGWWGHCNGWASYATADPDGPPARTIRVRLDDTGRLVECGDDDEDCVRFRKGDLEALMTEVWFDDAATFGGTRCNERPEDIERDELGRPIDPTCRDLNPGTFHVAITTLLGRGAEHLATGEDAHPPFVIDHSWDWEVWNFPIVAYDMTAAEEVDEAQATALVGGEGAYEWNERATGWVRVALTYWMVSDSVGPDQLRLRADERDVPLYAVDLNYVLELDEGGRVLGGEWIDTPTAFGPDSRELHPDFLWIAVDHQGATEQPNDLGGSNDNPFLSYRDVRSLVRCANDPTTCAPEAPDDTGTPPPPVEEAGGCGCASTGRGGFAWALVTGLSLARGRRGGRGRPRSAHR